MTQRIHRHTAKAPNHEKALKMTDPHIHSPFCQPRPSSERWLQEPLRVSQSWECPPPFSWLTSQFLAPSPQNAVFQPGSRQTNVPPHIKRPYTATQAIANEKIIAPPRWVNTDICWRQSVLSRSFPGYANPIMPAARASPKLSTKNLLPRYIERLSIFHLNAICLWASEHWDVYHSSVYSQILWQQFIIVSNLNCRHSSSTILLELSSYITSPRFLLKNCLT